MAGLLSVIALASAGAQQVRTPIAPGPRLPPAPAPVVIAADQPPRAIWALIRFNLPPNVSGVVVSRQQAGAQGVVLTPNPVPVASLQRQSQTEYGYYDNTLTALGTYSYSVVAVYADGRTGISAPVSFTPQLYEARSVNVQKADPYTAVITFANSALPAQTFRLYGTGIPAYGVEAFIDRMGHGKVTVGSLAAGTYNWVLRAEFQPGIRSAGVPVAVTLP
jgi:hypothetical protein